MLKPKSAFAKQYILTRSIDTNGLAEVWEAVSTKNNFKSTVALKIFPELGQKEINDFKNKVPKSLKYSYGNLLPANHLALYKNRPYLEMHFCNEGHIGKKLTELNENEIRKCLSQIASALNTLHNNSITHKYIKPSNILMGEGNFYCYLPDLGLGKNLRLKIEKSFKINNNNHSNDEVYLPRSFARVILNCYSAPELFEDSLNTSAASDIWALGASLYEIAVGKAPFGYLGGEKQLKSDVLQGLPEKFSSELNGLIKQCLSKNKEDRPSASEIVKWIEETSKEKNAITAPKKIIHENFLNNNETKSIVEIVEKKLETEENENRTTNDISSLIVKCEDVEILQLHDLAEEETTPFENVIEPININGETVKKFGDTEILQLQDIVEQEKTQFEYSTEPIDDKREAVDKLDDVESLQFQEIAERGKTQFENSIDTININNEPVNKFGDAEILQLQGIAEQETTYVEHATEPIDHNGETVNKFEDVEISQVDELSGQEPTQGEHSPEPIVYNGETLTKIVNTEILQLHGIVRQKSINKEIEPTIGTTEQVEKDERLKFTDIAEQESIINEIKPEIGTLGHLKQYGNVQILELQNNAEQETTTHIVPDSSINNFEISIDNYPLNKQSAEKETIKNGIDDSKINNVVGLILNNSPIDKQFNESQIQENENENFQVDHTIYFAPPNNVLHPLLIKLIAHETLTNESETFPPTNIVDNPFNENVSNGQSFESEKTLNGKKPFPFNTTIDPALYSDTKNQPIREPKPPISKKSKLLILFFIFVAAGIFVYLKWFANEPGYTIRPVSGWPINKIDSNRAIKANP